MEEEFEFEDYVMGLDENIEEVAMCTAEHESGEKENGIVLTVAGKDVVLLQSDLEVIVEYLKSFAGESSKKSSLHNKNYSDEH